jgi:NAD(P)-dependent dehydrogenase (short-subunit alcohol dehydrogenase family)
MTGRVESWHAIMDVHALGTLIGIQEGGARRMIPQRSGKIINTSSVAGRQGYPGFARGNRDLSRIPGFRLYDRPDCHD